MRDSQLQDRFDELDAARALGDLSESEQREWTRLVQEEGFKPDAELDWLVAGLEGAHSSSAPLPNEALRETLLVDSQSFAALAEKAAIVSFWRHPALGWAVAAGLVVGFFLFGRPGERLLTPALARQALVQESDIWRQVFAGTESFSEVRGDVVWSDTKQEGYMRLQGLPVNEPSERQYQLWIVDPSRDSVPVDGGVFDIASNEELVLPIVAKLSVSEPAAFVITVEQPGGVVVSKQEQVAAIATKAE